MISPSELMMNMLEGVVDEGIVPTIVVGPTTDAQQQEGVVSLLDAGIPRQERYAPLIWIRTQIRIQSPTMSSTDLMTNHIYSLLHQKGRQIVEQPSTGEKYLIHMTNITSGMSGPTVSADLCEALLFAESLIATEPIYTP